MISRKNGKYIGIGAEHDDINSKIYFGFFKKKLNPATFGRNLPRK